MSHYLFSFLNRTRVVTFGPYPTLAEAKEAFQRQYGYWPDMPTLTKPYVKES